MTKPESLQSVLLQIIGGAKSLVLVAEAAELLALDARFNLWVATVAKHEKGDAMLDLVDAYQTIVDECVEAVRKLEETNDADSFLATVRHLAARLKQSML